jgi:chaperonin cofactor prefoldin
MVKIAKSIPELMTIVKGLIQAVKAVSWCAFLEILLTYVFAIIFTQQYHNGLYMSDPCEGACEGDSANDFFGSLPRAAYSLIIFGSFFDDLTMCMDSLRGPGDYVYVLIFLTYMVLSGFIVMNMVIGILAEVITATGCDEKMSQKNDILGAAIRSIKAEMDTDNSGCISRHEFEQMKDHESVIKALEMLEIDEDTFNNIGNVMFHKDKPEDEDKHVQLPDLVETILKFQPDTDVSAVNIATLETNLKKSLKEIEKHLIRLDRVVAHANGECTFEELHRSGHIRPSTTLKEDGSPYVRGSLLDSSTGDIPKSVQDIRWAGVKVQDILNEIQRRMCPEETNPKGQGTEDKGGSAEPTLPGVPDVEPNADITT